MTNLTQFINGGMLLKQQLITANGNWSRPANMVGNIVYVTLIGGGESGGGPVYQRSGGWGGEYFIRMPVDIGAATSVPCTIGQGGAETSGAKNPGGATSFGAFLTALGGSQVASKGAPGGPAQTSASSPTALQNGMDTPLGLGGKCKPVGSQASSGGGGGGLILDTSGIGTTSTNGMTSAQGYGAGGAIYDATGHAGAPGAILVEWPEFV